MTKKSALIRYDYVMRLQKTGDVFDKKRCRFLHMDVVALCMPKAEDVSQCYRHGGLSCKKH